MRPPRTGCRLVRARSHRHLTPHPASFSVSPRREVGHGRTAHAARRATEPDMLVIERTGRPASDDLVGVLRRCRPADDTGVVYVPHHPAPCDAARRNPMSVPVRGSSGRFRWSRCSPGSRSASRSPSVAGQRLVAVRLRSWWPTRRSYGSAPATMPSRRWRCSPVVTTTSAASRSASVRARTLAGSCSLAVQSSRS